MSPLFLAQTLGPLVLILWMSLAPPRNLVGFCIQFAASEPRYRDWRGQSHGVDLVQLDRFGLRAKELQPADPHACRIYGTRVLAPCAGQVILAVDGVPDMQVPELDPAHMAGNHVLLRCAEADVLLGHLRTGSIQVRAGVAVAAGAWLGAVGNSGNTGEPHLHVHAQRPGPVGAPLGGDPLPIRFDGVIAAGRGAVGGVIPQIRFGREHYIKRA